MTDWIPMFRKWQKSTKIITKKSDAGRLPSDVEVDSMLELYDDAVNLVVDLGDQVRRLRNDCERLKLANEHMSTVDERAVGDLILENKRYKAALEVIGDATSGMGVGRSTSLADWELRLIARKALEDDEQSIKSP